MAPNKRHRTEGSSSHSLTPVPRSRTRHGQSILPTHTTALGGNLTFRTRAAKERYASLATRKILSCKPVHLDTLTELHVLDSYNLLIDNIGWRCFFDCTEDAFIELTREFYTTFEFSHPPDLTLDTPGAIKFRLLGREFSMTVTDFNIALGFTTPELARTHAYQTSLCDFRDDFHPIALWRTLSTDPSTYHPSRSKSSYLKDPVLKYVHRFLALNFSGRRDTSAICTKTEFFFLWCMLHGIKVNLGFWLATQLHATLNKKRPLILGSHITMLALNLGVLDLDHHDLHIAGTNEPLDMACLIRMGLVTRSGGLASFAPAGPSLPREASTSRRSPALHEDDANTSASDTNDDDASLAPPDPDTFATISRRLHRMEHNLMALFEHIGLTPPHPPSP